MKIHSVLRICLPAAALASLFPLSSTHAAAQAAAPAQSSGPVVNSALGTVTLPVFVVDDKGNAVKNLTAAELKLTDNGTAQTVQTFGPAVPGPIAFGIIGETGSPLHSELGDERLASVHFVDHTLPGSQDTAFVIQYAGEVDLLADPTTAQNKLHDAINQLGSPQFGSQNGGGSSDQSSGSPHWGGASGGTLYDAIYLASTEELKKQHGQHIIVLISDGVDHDSKETMEDAIEAAQNTHTAIFAIYYKSEEEESRPHQNSGRHGGLGGGFPGGGGGYPGGGGGYPGGGRRGGQEPSEQQPHVDGRANLIRLCSATGGYMVEGKRDKADEAYAKIEALIKDQYTLTFVPTKDATASDYQRITLTTDKKGVYPLIQQGLASSLQ